MEVLNKPRPAKDSYCVSFEIPSNLPTYNWSLLIRFFSQQWAANIFSLYMNMTYRTMFEHSWKRKYWYRALLVAQIYIRLEMNNRCKKKVRKMGLFRLEKNSVSQFRSLNCGYMSEYSNVWLLEEEWDHRITEWSS